MAQNLGTPGIWLDDWRNGDGGLDGVPNNERVVLKCLRKAKNWTNYAKGNSF